MTEQLIKSADRVKDHGEVFTPKWIVEKKCLTNRKLMLRLNP